MKNWQISLGGLLVTGLQCIGAEITTFPAYIDSNICARLMLGPITEARTQCSLQTFKEGDNAVVVKLDSNTVFLVNKEKMLKEYVSKFAEVTGEAKVKSGQMKLSSVNPIDMSKAPKDPQSQKLLDVRTYKVKDPVVAEKVRHELAMMPYITQYDFISFTMSGSDVILTGWTVRETNRSEAFNRVKSVKGVESVTNNIEVLPLGSFDMQIRAGAQAVLARVLSRYFWGSGSDIKIIVKNGNIILLGTVTSQADSDLANIQCNGVPSVFHVFNLLRVQEPKKKG